MSLIGHVYLPRSSKEGKKPKASELNYGELAINYNADHEFLSVKNSNGNVITFSSDNYAKSKYDQALSETSDNAVANSAITKVIISNEKVVAAALNDLNDRKLDASAYTKSHDDLVDNVLAWKKSTGKGSAVLNDSGNTSVASAYLSMAAGVGTKATTSAETAVGKYNVSNGKQLFSVGIGTSDTDRKNAFEINHDGSINLSATTFNITGNTYFSGDTYFRSGDTYVSFSAATDDIWSAITDDEEIVAAALNDLNDRKLDYKGLSGDSIISVVNTSSDNVTLSHKTGVVVNSSGVSGTAGKLTVNQTDKYGHIIATRDATAADIEGLGVASKGLVITYGTVKTLPTGYTYGTARTYDGKTVMNLSVPQKITDLEGGNDLNYVHLSGDTMYGKLCLKATSASTANTITLNNADGTITATTMFSTSDKRLKENIKEISDDEIEKVKNVDLKSFKYINDRKQHFGVIAQELEESGLGELVSFDSNGYKTVDYISLLILKIAELEREIKKLKDNKED